ncbi:OLC1v1035349C1 [Oldenlandia corymbosa var. corymbosa]|uniref:OLC1v1035349C1 n=1 Tax=Oldenlandia corymbosa var. corymbosa TaxID=529605 RepID=A0AAV1CVA7_OLDCO|nr:OLC1v1035349C1 [Oldenlandia corymbosa var. corymbosa]
MMMKKFLVLVVMLVILLFGANAHDGYATLNTIYSPSACYGNDTPLGLIASASPQIWDNGNSCGRRYSVTCTDGTNLGTPHPCNGHTVEVEIVDYCPHCKGTFDLSQEAFAAIADTDAGFIRIDYHRI